MTPRAQLRPRRIHRLDPPEPTPSAPRPLAEEEIAILAAIVSGLRAWSSRDGLIALGHDPITLFGMLTTGWLCVGEVATDGDVLTLTPWAAERLGVWIDETAGGHEFWQGAGLPPRQVRAEKMSHERPLPCPWLVEDHRKGPEDEAAEKERYLTREATREDGHLDVDESTGQVRREEILIFGQRVKVDPRIGRRRPKGGRRAKRRAG